MPCVRLATQYQYHQDEEDEEEEEEEEEEERTIVDITATTTIHIPDVRGVDRMPQMVTPHITARK